jgi:hypothetical protein
MFIRHSAQPDLIRDDVMRSMFAARKAVFVDLLQWDLPVHDGRYEIDQFDDPHAHYIILSQEDGNHLGSARLLPTSRPHILGSLYPQLCAEAPPSGPDIFEITRFCLDRRLRAPSGGGYATLLSSRSPNTHWPTGSPPMSPSRLRAGQGRSRPSAGTARRSDRPGRSKTIARRAAHRHHAPNAGAP